jgi:hypothetical protein
VADLPEPRLLIAGRLLSVPIVDGEFAVKERSHASATWQAFANSELVGRLDRRDVFSPRRVVARGQYVHGVYDDPTP